MKHEYHVVQPWGADRARQATIVSSHPSAESAFAEIDRLSMQMLRTGVDTNAVELIVIDAADRIIRRPES